MLFHWSLWPTQPPNEKPDDKDKQENKDKQEKPTRKLPNIECRSGAGHLKNIINITTSVKNMNVKQDEQDYHDVEK